MPDLQDPLTEAIIGAALDVHRALGPGLLESAYTACLAFELVDRGMNVRRQVPVPIVYRGHDLGLGYRLDLLVEDQVIVEVKSVAQLDAVHTAQLLAYLKLSSRRVGLLINFNVKWLVNGGVRRIVNGSPR